MITYPEDSEYPLTFDMNYNWFLKSNKKFNKKIAHLSAIFSGLAYYAPYDKEASYYKIKNKKKKYQTFNLEKFMQYTGFRNVNRYYLGKKYSDNHIVQFNYGYKTLKKGKTTKYLVPIVIRGTSGSKEWFSNFTIGKKGPHDGFNIAANRIIKEIDTYLNKNKIDTKNAILWVTGHSRGGGVSNLVAKKLIDKKYKVFAYTFAAPAVTQTSYKNKAKYKHIYNTINQQDFVPRLPLSKWGFDLYGTTRIKELTKNQQSVFKNRVGKSYSALNSKKMSNLVRKLEGVSASREDCFKYTCACHSSLGKQLGKSITLVNICQTEDEARKDLSLYKDKLTKEQLKFCKLEVKAVSTDIWKFTVCQSPMFFMSKIAEGMNGLLSGYKFATFRLASKYTNARNSLVFNSTKVKTPHYIDSYIILT